MVVQRARQRPSIVVPAAEVERELQEGVVHGHQGVPVARAFVRERLADRSTDSNGDVFDDMVPQVPSSFYEETDTAVATQCDEHVIEKWHACSDIVRIAT